MHIIAGSVSGAGMQVIASWTGAQATALQQALRMTNESFAEYLDVSVRTVCNWPRGQR